MMLWKDVKERCHINIKRTKSAENLYRRTEPSTLINTFPGFLYQK